MTLVRGRVKVSSTATPTRADDVSYANIIVFDGIRSGTVEKWRGLMNNLARAGVAVFVVSSEGVRFHEGDSGDVYKLLHFHPSWVRIEYLEACRNDQFWKRHCDEIGGSLDDDFDRRTALVDAVSAACLVLQLIGESLEASRNLSPPRL
jgi:hypothetical protein